MDSQTTPTQEPMQEPMQEPVKSSSLLATTVDIFASPGEAFRAIQARPSILYPFFLVLLPTTLVYLWYFQVVDYAWFIDDSIARFGNMSAEQQEAMRAVYAQQSQTMAMVMGVIGSLVSIAFIYVLHAGYLALVSSVTGDKYRFRHWFSLLCWTNLPSLLVTLVIAVNIVLSPTGQISLYDANSLSLASLGLQTEGAAMQGVADTLNLAMFWCLALLVAGYRQWLQVSWLRAVLIVLAPYLLILGIVFYFALS